MSINQELSFDFKSQVNFDNDPQQSHYSNFAEQWQEKISSLQQNIQEMQQQKEDVKNALLQAQSRIKNKKSYIDEPKMQQVETRTLETNLPIQNTSINHLLNESINTQEFQTPINQINQVTNIRQQPIATFLMDIRLNDIYLQNFIDLGIYDNVSLLKSLPAQNKCKFLLNKYGIDKLGYQRRILAKLDEEMGLFSKKGLLLNIEYCQEQIPNIEEWLKSINQSKYYPNFLLAGYDNFAYLIYQEQSQYKLKVQDFKDSFYIESEQDRQLLIAHIVIICDKMMNCDLWTVQGIKKKQQESDFNLVQCTLPSNQCLIF
ncbi:unnamed protein product [Paramecium octaurelia]|uniref:Uncharacterized protein n=1 Tax=Paramecium octaurelia TaxID=43137 RepID=A0A8S1XRY7_PAROT|nr:unnamed protein product [Paramecium octaurelia]